MARELLSQLKEKYSKRAALLLPRRATELIGIRRVITDKKGNKSHMSVTFIQHSLKRHSPFRPAGSLWKAAIVMLSDGCTLRIVLWGSYCCLGPRIKILNPALSNKASYLLLFHCRRCTIRGLWALCTMVEN